MISEQLKSGFLRLGIAIAMVSAIGFGAPSSVTANHDDGGPRPEFHELPAALQASPNVPIVNVSLGKPGHAPRREMGPGGGCDKNVDLSGTIDGLVAVGAVDTMICDNADIDVYVQGIKTFVVQAGRSEAAWIITDVSDPALPTIVDARKWTRSGKNTQTPDIKAFKQGDNRYIVMGLERESLSAPCGVVIYDITLPTAPDQMSQYNINGVCDVHNVFVEEDGNGDGAYVFVAANNTTDLRVLDILSVGSVSNPVQVGIYGRVTRGFMGPGFYDDIYVHDVTVEGGVVYASYWEAGLDIFDAILVQSTDATPFLLNETGDVTTIKPVLDPNATGMPTTTPFLTHHAYPNKDGTLVFVEDEITSDTDADLAPVSDIEPVQLWDTATQTYIDGILLGTDVPVNPAHNIEVEFGTESILDRVYVGWYKLGLQAWDFDANGIKRVSRDAPDDDRTAAVYHQAQTEGTGDPYDGAWGIRFATIDPPGEEIGENLYVFQSDRSFGLIVNCEGNTENCGPTAVLDGGDSGETTEDVGNIKGTVTVDGSKTSGVIVTADTDESDDTNRGGKYSIGSVSVDVMTVTATYINCSEQRHVILTAGETITEDFELSGCS